MKRYVKDPDAVLDYKFDWKALANGSGESNWLSVSSPAETIASHEITIVGDDSPVALIKDSSSLTDTNTSVTVWLSGGTGGRTYTVSCKIVTSASRTDERSIEITVRNR